MLKIIIRAESLLLRICLDEVYNYKASVYEPVCM